MRVQEHQYEVQESIAMDGGWFWSEGVELESNYTRWVRLSDCPPTADLVFHGQRSALGEYRSVGKDWVCMEEKNKGADLFNE